MNRKGFTLIELLAVIVLIGIIGVIAVPNVLDAVNASKNGAYQILIDNIISASENYYMECEYGDLSDSTKYGANACTITGSTITTTLGTLAQVGFLKTDSSKKVLNPNNNNDLSSCKIKITKTKNGNIITYTVTKNDSQSNCPSTYKKVGQ